MCALPAAAISTRARAVEAAAAGAASNLWQWAPRLRRQSRGIWQRPVRGGWQRPAMSAAAAKDADGTDCMPVLR